ncbi:MAG: hypothetical protein EA398_14095 [Deltaproteobacteria bacterium]|nr:MAG: hypothetical protein EA398_14095 [Deltaproteobacteria bacterium]
MDAAAQARRAAGAAAEPEPAAQAPVAAGTGADPHTAGARARIAVAVLGAATVGCLFYGVDRTRAALTEDPYDPLLILESARIDYFWRIGISGFLAVTVFLALLQWRGAAEPERLGQAYRVALVALALSTFLSAVFP